MLVVCHDRKYVVQCNTVQGRMRKLVHVAGNGSITFAERRERQWRWVTAVIGERATRGVRARRDVAAKDCVRHCGVIWMAPFVTSSGANSSIDRLQMAAACWGRAGLWVQPGDRGVNGLWWGRLVSQHRTICYIVCGYCVRHPRLGCLSPVQPNMRCHNGTSSSILYKCSLTHLKWLLFDCLIEFLTI